MSEEKTTGFAGGFSDNELITGSAENALSEHPV